MATRRDPSMVILFIDHVTAKNPSSQIGRRGQREVSTPQTPKGMPCEPCISVGTSRSSILILR